MHDTLGKRIVSHRKRMKLTQDQLAEKLCVTPQAISKWENDISCPDISLLPKIAELFGITTDSLLGCGTEQKTIPAEIINSEDDQFEEGIHVQKGNFEFRWDSSRRDAVGFAVCILLFGILYLISQIFSWPVTFWGLLWPSALVGFGISGVYTDFSFLRVSSILFGGYSLISKICGFSIQLEKGIFWAVLVILFGGSLLIDALKKPKRRRCFLHKNHNKNKNDYSADDTSFSYHACFGENSLPVMVPNLQQGDIQVSFGEYTIDLTQVGKIMPNCQISASCSFGELRLLISKSCKLTPSSSTSFAGFKTVGSYSQHHTSEIFLDANVSFGEISVEYV